MKMHQNPVFYIYIFKKFLGSYRHTSSIRRQSPTTGGRLPCSMAHPILVLNFVCLSAELVKLAEPIEMPFGLWTRVGPRNHVGLLHGVPNQWERAFLGAGGQLQSIGTRCRELCKNDWTVQDTVWVMDLGGAQGNVLNGVQIPNAKGQFLGERTCPGMCGDTLSWAVQNGWTDRHAAWVANSGGSKKEACVSWGARWRHLANTNGPSACGDAGLWQILLWPLVFRLIQYRTFALCDCFRMMSRWEVCQLLDRSRSRSQSSAIFDLIAFLNCSSITLA